MSARFWSFVSFATWCCLAFIFGLLGNFPVNNIDTNDFVLKTKHNTDKKEVENKIPNATDFVKKAKLAESEKKFLILVIYQLKLH